VIATESSLAFFKVEDVEWTGARVWRNRDEWSVSTFAPVTILFLSSDFRRATTRLAIQSCTLSSDAGLILSSLRHAPPIRSRRSLAACVITSPFVMTIYSSGILSNLSMCLQTSVLRALSPETPTYIFPAMNTFMYEHPLTAEHLRVVREVIKYTIVGPIGKALACGDIGVFPSCA
jgi:phosphopantothenoylcysteine decarboxylase